MNKGISVNPNLHFGKPCITGTRIPVQNILELVREGFSFAEIARNYYPDIGNQPSSPQAFICPKGAIPSPDGTFYHMP